MTDRRTATAIRPTRRSVLAGLGACSCTSFLGIAAPHAHAHRARVSLTRVVPNRAAGRWEFITTVHLHDAAVAIATLTGQPAADPTSPNAQARLILELERTMRWSTPSGRRLQPDAEGAELLGNDLALYQSLTAPQDSGEYSVESRFLHAVYPDMVNSVQWDVMEPSRLERLTAARPRAGFAWRPVSAGP